MLSNLIDLRQILTFSVDDECDENDIAFVKIDDDKEAAEWGIDEIPTIVKPFPFYKNFKNLLSKCPINSYEIQHFARQKK